MFSQNLAKSALSFSVVFPNERCGLFMHSLYMSLDTIPFEVALKDNQYPEAA